MMEDEVDLNAKIENVNSREDLADYIEDLRRDLEKNRDDWENVTLDQYLEAVEGYTRDIQYVYINRGEAFPEAPTWSMIADILFAAARYE